MRAPSFRCTEREEDGATILHYYSEREGLESIVIGIVQTVANKLHNSEVDVEIIKRKGEDCDHCQLLIIDKNGETKSTKANLEEYEDTLSKEPKISPATFCRACPFHVMFDRNMIITQAGASITRLIPRIIEDRCHVGDLFTMIRPHMDFTFQTILSHINTIFVLCSNEGVLQDSLSNGFQDIGNSMPQKNMRLKGQMVYVPESDSMLFLCSPSVMNLEDLNRRGLYLSDIPLHDATRDLVILSEQFEAEYKLTKDLEILTDELQQTYRELECEKSKTDKYLSNIL